MVVPFSHSNTLFVTRDGVPMRFYVRPGPQKRQLAPLIAHGGGLMCRIQEPGAFLLADPSEAAQGPGYISTTYIFDCVSANRSLSPRVYRLLPCTHRGATAARDAPGRLGNRAFGGNPMTLQGVDNMEASPRTVPKDTPKGPASRALKIDDGGVSQGLTTPVTSRDGQIEQLKHRQGLASSHGTSRVMDTEEVLPVDLIMPVTLDLRTTMLAPVARADAFVGENNPLASPSEPMDLKYKEVDGGHKEDPKNVTGRVSSNSSPLGEPSGENGAGRQPCFPNKMATKLVLKEDHGTSVTPDPTTRAPAPKAPSCATADAPNHEDYLSVFVSPFKKTDSELPGGHNDDLQNNTVLATCKDPSFRGSSPFPSKIASELSLHEDSSALVIADPRTGLPVPSAPYYGKDSEVDTGYGSIAMNDEGSHSSAIRVPKRKFRERKRRSGGEGNTSHMAKQKRAEKQLHVPGDEPENNLQTPRLGNQELLSMDEQQAIIHERAMGEEQETVYERSMDGEQSALNEETMGGGKVAVDENILEEGQRSVYKKLTGGEQVARYERANDGEQVVLPERPTVEEQGATCERPTGGEQEAVCEWSTSGDQGPVWERPTCSKQVAMCEEPTHGKQRAVCERSMGLEQEPRCAEQEAMCKRSKGGELGYVCERSKEEEQLPVYERTTREHLILHERTTSGEQVAIGEEHKSVTMRTIYGGLNNFVTDHEIQSIVTSVGVSARGSTQELSVQNMDNQQVQPVMVPQSPNPCAALAQGRMAFTREEDMAILIYVRDHISSTRTVTGNRLWKDLEEKRLLRRSWQAMKARYVKYLTNHKYKYKLPPKSQPLWNQNCATAKTPDSAINNSSAQSSRSVSTDTPQKPATGDTPQGHNVPLHSDCGNTPRKYTTMAPENNTQHDPSAGPLQRTSGPEKRASVDTPQGNDFIQHGPSALKSNNVPQNCASTYENHAPQHSASTSAPQKNNVLQHSATSDTLQESNATNCASAPLRSNVPPNSASAGTMYGNNATQHGASTDTLQESNATNCASAPLRSNVPPNSPSAGTTYGNNATQHGATAGTPQGSDSSNFKRSKVPENSDKPHGNPTQLDASSDTRQESNAQNGASVPQRKDVPHNCASVATPNEKNVTQSGALSDPLQGSCVHNETCTPQKSKTTHHVLSTASNSYNQNNIPEFRSSSTSKGRSSDAEDDYESSSRKGSSMLSSPRPANTVQLEREETDGSEELHIFKIANMEFEVEDNKGSGQPAAWVPPEEVAVSSNHRRPVDEMTSSQEEESEGLQEAISDLMREFQLDLFSVTQALFFNNCEVGSTRHFLRHGLRPDGFPIWEPKADSDLNKNDPNMRARLIKKYGADNVAKRVAFLTS